MIWELASFRPVSGPYGSNLEETLRKGRVEERRLKGNQATADVQHKVFLLKTQKSKGACKGPGRWLT